MEMKNDDFFAAATQMLTLAVVIIKMYIKNQSLGSNKNQNK